MANVFLNTDPRDIETAIMLEQAIIHDIGKSVAYTDGKRIFINTEDNLNEILPNYNIKMLKWLLWHERVHNELRHNDRFFRYVSEINDARMRDEFTLNKSDVNIIMDILVHDSLCKWFPELIETAIENLAQLRNRNSLGYTFTTFTLEEMLDEFAKHKKSEDEDDGDGEDSKETKEGKGKDKDKSKHKSTKDDDKSKDEPKESGEGKSEPTEDESSDDTEDHKDGADRPEDGEPDVDETASEPPKPEPEHDKTDWSKLDDIDSKEFITEDESYRYREQINRLKRKNLRLAKLTETLNGLATSTRKRTYAKPNPIKLSGGAVLKGSTPGKAKLYLCFDASGSMGSELETFKQIISKSIPQAMEVPCEWFTHKYGKGKFKDIMHVYANSGFKDDGDRVIELCWKAEQQGYSPIGVTDGGGRLSWSVDKLKQLKRTIIVGQDPYWLKKVKEVNPNVQTLDI